MSESGILVVRVVQIFVNGLEIQSVKSEHFKSLSVFLQVIEINIELHESFQRGIFLMPYSLEHHSIVEKMGAKGLRYR